MKKYYIVVLAIFMVFSLQAKEKNITKTFLSNNVEILKLESKLGDVKIENWAKDEIEINVAIKALSNKQLVAEKIVEKVKIKFKHKREVLFVKTDFASFFSFKKFTNNLFRGGEFRVDYHIKMPKDIKLDVTLREGNIILYERTADVKILHKNGNISIEKLRGFGAFKLSGSSLHLDKANDLLVNARDSRIIVNESKNLKVKSYHSDYELQIANKLEGEFQRDAVKIGQLRDIAGTAEATVFELGKLEEIGVLNLNRGAFTLEHIQPEFRELKLTANRAKLAILLTPTPANILISHHSSTVVDINDSMDLHMKFGETQKDFISSGKVGNPQGKNRIFIDTKGGELHLK